VPGCGWVRFRLTRTDLPQAKTFRVTLRNGCWHIAFAVVPGPVAAPGTGEVIGVDRGVTITAALSDGRKLNCPQLTVKERAQVRKHQRRAARAPKASKQKTAAYAKVARLKAREADRRKDWCEKTSTMLARTYRLVRFEKLTIKNMTRSAKGTTEQPGRQVRQKAQEPSRVRLLLLRLHLQRGHQRSNQRRGRTGRDSPPPALSRCRRDDSGHQPLEHP
jgi:putative transposase